MWVITVVLKLVMQFGPTSIEVNVKLADSLQSRLFCSNAPKNCKHGCRPSGCFGKHQGLSVTSKEQIPRKMKCLSQSMKSLPYYQTQGFFIVFIYKSLPLCCNLSHKKHLQKCGTKREEHGSVVRLVSQDVMLCSLMDCYRYLEGTCCLHLEVSSCLGLGSCSVVQVSSPLPSSSRTFNL